MYLVSRMGHKKMWIEKKEGNKRGGGKLMGQCVGDVSCRGRFLEILLYSTDGVGDPFPPCVFVWYWIPFVGIGV